MQQRREMDRRRNPEEDEGLEKPESVPNFLTARELQAREPAPRQDGDKPVGERRVVKERRRNPG